MTRLFYAALAAAWAGNLSVPAQAQIGPPVQSASSELPAKEVNAITRGYVLVEPANVGMPRSRTIVVAGTEEDSQRIANYDPALARLRWKQGYGSKNFLIETGEFERMQKVAHSWELAYQGMAIVDAAQTIVAVRNGKAIELNPLLGRRPKVSTIIAFKAVTGALHYGLFRYANARNPNTARKGAIASFALQSGYVGFSLAFGH